MNDQHRLHNEINAATAIKDSILKLTDDDDVIRDTLEGETSLHELIGAVLESIDDDQLIVDGCKSRVKDLTERKQRIDKRISAKKTMIEQAMIIAELPSIETPVATASIKKVPPKVIISEEAEIPTDYWKSPDPVLDKKALGQALKDGLEVPGATLSNGGVTLALRRK